MSKLSSTSQVIIGVGIDTARYGHHVTFTNQDRATALRGFTFPESRPGYQKLHDALKHLAAKHHNQILFQVRLDAAGQYAANLEAFVRQLPFNVSFSVGEPKRNRDYKNAHYPKAKSDPIDSAACARFAVVEQPPHAPAAPPEFLELRDLVATLSAQSRQTTRCINQLHKLLARVFPELALIANNIAEQWVLELLRRYPTPARIAAARLSSLSQLPHVSPERALHLQQTARSTTGSFTGPFAENLVVQAVQSVCDSQKRETECLAWIELSLDSLPPGGHRHLISIPGIGPRTAAVLIAKIFSIDRFQRPEQLVSYFGVFPEVNSSGVDKTGAPVSRGQQRMSTRGCDLVRKMLWMAALTAIRFNPPIQALYARKLAARKPPSVALGHCMHKLLHQVFAIWKTNRPFDKCYSARTPPNPHAATPQSPPAPAPSTPTPMPADSRSQKNAAAGRTGVGPRRTAVTATASHLRTRKLSPVTDLNNPKIASPATAATPISNPTGLVDFADLRRRVSINQVLDHLGHFDHLTGSGSQRRGACPIHDKPGTAPKARHFSVNLERNLFRCLHPQCQAKGNALDLWAAVRQLPIHAAAIDLAKTFQVPLTSPQGVLPPPTTPVAPKTRISTSRST